jgi:hypothetical protein
MAVVCPECGSKELELVEVLEDERRKIRCASCGHEWLRGEAKEQQAPRERHDPAAAKEITVFVNDDDGYETWNRRNAIGYVINCYRNPNPEYLILHDADCYSISDPQTRTTTWTAGDYIKVCSRSRPALEEWAKERTGTTPSLCGICFG